VSHGYEEAEEEEDVEVTLPAREPCIGLRAGFVFRDAQRSDLKTGRCRFYSGLAVTPPGPLPTAAAI